MTTSAEAVQRAMYGALTAAGVTVYDEPPEGAAFPYVTIGGGLESARNTMGRTGRQVMATVNVWSESGQDANQDGFGEALRVAGQVDGVLDGATLDLSVDGWTCVACDLEQSQPLRDPDGITRRVMMTYRVLTEAA